MVEQIRILSKIELCNLYGWNVFRHTKDKSIKKKNIALAGTIGLVLVLIMFYMGAMSYGLVLLGAAEIVPAYLNVMASLFVLMFGVLKAGGVIFRNKGYDIISSLPLSDGAVVMSRFIRLYVEGLAVALLVMVPGLLVYGVLVRPGLWYYLLGVLGVLGTPLVPVAVAAGIGTLITGIASRMKHKALVEAGLGVLLVVGIFVVSSLFSDSAGEVSLEMMQNLVEMVSAALGKVYPLAILMGNGMVQGKVGSSLLFVLISAAVFVGVVWIVAVNFHGICRRLYSTSAKHEYQLEQLQKQSVTKAMVVREARRYFSSGVYVTNTIIGPVLGTVFCVALPFLDIESITGVLPIQISVNSVLPFVFAGIFCVMNTTSTSVSMEGKEWWIVKSLPLSVKHILDGKILFNLCLWAPFYMVSEAVVLLTQDLSVTEGIWMVLIPALFMVFSCVFGIAVNLKFPKLQWENEVEVVKQSVSAVIGGMGGFFVAIVSACAVLLVPVNYTNVVCLGICILLVVITVLLYHRNNSTDLKKI